MFLLNTGILGQCIEVDILDGNIIKALKKSCDHNYQINVKIFYSQLIRTINFINNAYFVYDIHVVSEKLFVKNWMSFETENSVEFLTCDPAAE